MQSEQLKQTRAEELLMPYEVKFGVPLLYPEAVKQGHPIYVATIPEKPHVCLVQQLRIVEQGVHRLTISNAVAMIGHGLAYGYDADEWFFRGTGQSVMNTVRGYEKVAEQLYLPPLDVLLVCREDPPFERPKVSRRFTFEGIPYVLPNALVTLGDENEEWSNYGWPGEGIRLVVARADSWSSVERWESHWGRVEGIREARRIPTFYKDLRLD